MLFENSVYIYEGYPASPSVLVEIIFYLYKNNTKIISRKEIIEEVFDFHLKNNGVSNDAEKISQIKKALADINSICYKNIRVGYYQFLINEYTKFEDFYQPKRNKKIANNKIEKNEIKSGNNIDIKNGWVYFYYFEGYKNLAKFQNEIFFPIKIGKTKSNPHFRVSEQTGTALPEKPIIFLQVKIHDCSSLEKLIHSTLSLMGQKSNTSVGSEWYISNEQQIYDLLSNYEKFGIKMELVKNKDLDNINE